MKLLSLNAEQLLLEKLKELTPSHDSWRCIYINFSDAINKVDESYRTIVVTSLIKDLLDEKDGSIYLCNNGDVLILFQGQASPILEKMGSSFSDLLLGADSAANKDNQYTLFDLSKHWDNFYKICQNKFAPKVVVAKELAAQEKPVQTPLPEVNHEVFRAADSKRAGRKRQVVLIVEDDPFTRRLIIGTLKQEFDVIEAGSGLSAIKAYESSAPDAVFLDIELPDTTGHVLLNKFLSLDKNAFVVMLSANTIKENILAALNKGAQGFVAKPFTKEKLLHYLKMCSTFRLKNNLGDK